jgi:hypothetical protein
MAVAGGDGNEEHIKFGGVCGVVSYVEDWLAKNPDHCYAVR